ncbi:ATP-binding protein [Oceanicaulis sp. LC35]|uniref:ATP-binding protein n=1 Tax=Oceanicaulis sp. LC35 TaxID=3349635 RepID=UPI003F852659
MEHPILTTVSLRTKILVLVVTVTVSVAMVVGFANFIQASSMSRAAARSELNAETRVIASHISTAFRIARDQAFIIRNTPPIEGIIRAQRNDGIDPLDGSSLETWRARLADIFSAHLAVEREYTQIRYIGIEDGGREIVRVNRVGEDGFSVVPDDLLQRKQNEFYFLPGIQAEESEIYTSPITANREFGDVSSDMTPTVRTIVSVHTPEGAPYGMIAINSDIRVIFEEALMAASSNYEVYISDEDGNYIHYQPGVGIVRNQYAFQERFEPPALLSLDGEALQDVAGVTYVAYTLNTGRAGEAGLSFRILVGEPTEALMQGAYAIRQQSMMLAVSLVVLTAIGSLLFVTSLTRPLGELTQAVHDYGQSREPIEINVTSNDEIGDLGRAFVGMTKALQQSELSANTFENIIDGLILLQPDGIIQAMNPAARFMFGYEEDELIGQDISVLLPNGVRLEREGSFRHIPCFIEQHLVGETFEAEACQKNQDPLFVELTLSDVHKADSTLFSLLIRDISVRKQMEIMKDEFVSTVNHELRTPLTSMLGSLRLLKARLESKFKDDEKASMLLNMAQRSSDRLNHLVNDILDLEKIAAGKLEYRMEVVPCDDLVQDVVESHRVLAEEHGVTFELDLQAGDPPVNLDVSRFTQALVNLLSNAAKYSPPDEVVTIMTRRPTSSLIRISVSDNGPGIPEDFQDRIFERFSQADSSPTRRVGGNGLGLNITKNLVEAFDGQIDFDTKVGEGTVFHITLPIVAQVQSTSESNDVEAFVTQHSRIS